MGPPIAVPTENTTNGTDLFTTTVDIIISEDPSLRNLSLAEFCSTLDADRLLLECRLLDDFRRKPSQNLYHKVRACFFLYAIHRFHLPVVNPNQNEQGVEIPYQGYKSLCDRHFEEAIDVFLQVHCEQPSESISSALAKAYYHLGFQTLADQVRLSVRNHPGNAWMYEVVQPGRHPLKVILPWINGNDANQSKILMEQTPVRMDLSHCGWSDIFFLGMDFPEGARVLNISIDLAVRGRHQEPLPPIDCFLQAIDEPVLKLTSIDLKAEVTLTHIAQVFDFCKDYLGLLRAGIIASGIIPLGLEGSEETLQSLFDNMVGPGKGLHLTTRVNDIPKGSRLAVSTNLLSSIISLGMRATGQTKSIEGSLTEDERRLVAARAILGEWLGGSGGGWQDSGGVWPGIKLIQGVKPEENHPEFGVSRGRLLPVHRQLSDVEAPARLAQSLQDHLILVHGGMAQNVGPILEMVTEKYLLREADEWNARHDALRILDDILEAFKSSDVPKIAKLTTDNFFEPLQTIIPWASNLYTETLIDRTKLRFGDDFLGFWMLGGASGGGMGFIFKPEVKPIALVEMQVIMISTKKEMEHALPFAMDPVVYDFKINDHGTKAQWFDGCSVPTWKEVSTPPSNHPKCPSLSLDDVLCELGFDLTDHCKIQNDYRRGEIGLKQNRLPTDAKLENARPEDVILTDQVITPEIQLIGMEELRKGAVGVISLAAGVGSRWTQGAGCVKAINPFCKIAGRHRSFLEVHLAKSRRISTLAGMPLQHVITTSYMTDSAIHGYLDRVQNHGYEGPLYISPGKTIGLRLIPTANDLKFSWQNQPKLDKQAQKVRESGQQALLEWVKSCGEASDYRDNLPLQCLHPVGHFYEVPNLLLNGTLKTMLDDRPQLRYLMLHNIDTVGADVDPGLLGLFVSRDSTLSFEVIARRIDDVGGGLAMQNGKVRLVEGLALPNEEDEFKFTYYNSMTTWIDIDKLLKVFGISRNDLADELIVSNAIHTFSAKLPTYVALKEVKKRWGNGQEDVFPTAQFEKLWSDLSSLDEVDCDFFAVSRHRGCQLKDVSQLDGWLRDGSQKYLEKLCFW
ncbi:UTP-glucose-1-phosphate uridylyltransferase [Nitzschia inconspicua]|uniref:UTP-glucose-1-phosphate uridylyltransferase n=1 Tax=Nitzschia inconspicua TaxID=303405 RepID=A0A9K3PQZ0_9STRA|nr:UTP-glucose-1-phosphate uridylyltransferase [Nitzschia inconspicua]